MTSSREPLVRIDNACEAGSRLLPQIVARIDQLEAMVAGLVNEFSRMRIEMTNIKERVERLELERAVALSINERLRELNSRADRLLSELPAD